MNILNVILGENDDFLRGREACDKHKFRRQHLHPCNPQQTSILHEGVQGDSRKRKKHNGMACWIQASSTVQ